MMKKLTVIVSTFLLAVSVFLIKWDWRPVPEEVICINEICSHNFSVRMNDEEDEYWDYVELYNRGTEPVDLTGYTLSDDVTRPFRFIFPQLTLSPGAYVVVALAGQEALGREGLYADFKISTGESVVLQDGDGNLVDTLTVPELRYNTAYGRLVDGGSDIGIQTCTPEENNKKAETPASINMEMPAFSVESGWYEQPFYLSIEAPEGCRIYYTLDGSEPDEKAMLYEEPLRIENASIRENVWSEKTELSVEDYEIPDFLVDKASVIRAAAYDEVGGRSETATAVYFVNYGDNAGYDNIYVLSLVTDPDNLFDYEKGIYVKGKTFDEWLVAGGEAKEMVDYRVQANFRNKGREWERETEAILFRNQQLLMEQTIGIRTRGKSGGAGPTKNLNLYARSIYDEEAMLSYDILQNGKEYSRLMLKGWQCNYSDGFIMSLLKDRAFAVADTKPVCLFLDGEYWGLYCFMERYNEEYVESYYGIRPDNAVILKNGEIEEGVLEDVYSFYDLQEFAETEDLSEESAYKEISAMVDIQSLIDYYCVQIFIDNWDCSETYNMAAWRCRNPEPGQEMADGKWRFMLYDIDASLQDYTRDNMGIEIREGRPAFFEHSILKGLLANDEFRRDFVNTMCDIMNVNFAVTRVDEDLTAMANGLEEAWEKHCQRFPSLQAADETADYAGYIERMREFYEKRPAYVRQLLQKYFAIEDYAELTVKAEGIKRGSVKVNTSWISLDKDEWKGIYASNVPISLAVEETKEVIFEKWIVETVEGSLWESHEKSLELLPEEISKVTVCFAEKK